ncbi:sterol carrier family protein [Leucobacter ruminantium]|uniref:Bacterial SCP orthologue domain-containing protein n=1 Tax=Leucobacter ruminantium TaxID=1289170 RepID=A0A939LZH7_9MICO|nr:sterol carrier family protein [Leucobacter ruminantium]MBO1805292.1 hypothetical protein [Leucobacter ruminantium]
MAKRRIPVEDGRTAVTAVLGGSTARPELATAVRYLLEELAERAPGNTVEVRVPPFGATQCVEGPRHTRGTPPNVIETDAATWVALATGSLAWETALDAARVTASGSRANLDGLLPLTLRASDPPTSPAPDPSPR